MGDVVGSIAGTAIEVLLQNLISLCAEEISLIRNFKKDLDKLRKSCEMIQAFLNDAEKKQVTDEAVKRWLINLEAVAFDADNVLDELNYEVLRRKMKTGNKLKKKVQALFSTRKMALEIRSINENLTLINQEATEFGLQRQLSAHVPSVGSHHTLTERETASHSDPIVVGRENHVSNIVEILTSSDVQEVFSVLPIVGMGGLGKTTLAKLVFHDKKIETHFEKRIWVYVSESFDEMALLKKIHESLTESSNDDFKTKDALLRNLRENLEAKKYLLVLDDVWTEETKKWDDFVDTLSSINSIKGNSIIVTTRSENVASIVRTTHIPKLSGLPDEDCWSIIKEKAFKKGYVIPLEFETIGKKIANKCRGLPLAAKVVGGLLRGKSKEEWYAIEETGLSNLGEDGNTIQKILKLSFDNLQSQSLKKCFAFCAIFPKGYKISREMLTTLWMAEGFLQSDQGGNDMETVGDKYFDLLLHKSLLQVWGQGFDGSIRYYIMHDLVHDLAFSILNTSGLVRYIYMKSTMEIPKEKARNVRSLIFEGKISDDNMFSDFSYLRCLVLIGDGNKQLPKIEHLKHLRYLDILATPIGCSPKSIGNLYLLQTFRANIASNELPETLKKLINLRHVYIRSIEETTAETQLGREVVASPCLEYQNLKTLYIVGVHSTSLLENLLVNITSLTELHFEQLEGLVCLPDVFFRNNQNLAYLRISDCGNFTHLPPHFGVSLRAVEIICCWKLEGLPENLHCLDNLTLISCPNIKSIPYNPSCNQGHDEIVRGFPSLRELNITTCGGLTELPIGLLESCTSSLKSVCLKGLGSLTNMGMVIGCLQKMPHLTSLSVDFKHLATDNFPIEIVGSFESLRDLWITCGMEIWYRLQDQLQHLTALRALKLYHLDIEAVPEWLEKLSSLQELELFNCPKLTSLPSKQALKHLTRLRGDFCPLLNLRSRDDNSDWHKVSHIANVRIG